MFVIVPYYDIPYSQYQPCPSIYSPSFEEKVLQVLDRIEINNQILHSSMQSLTELEIQIDQPAIAFSREKEGELLSQSESNPQRQYLAKSFNVPIISSNNQV